MSTDPYPTKAELLRVKKWKINDYADCEALLMYVRTLWWNPDWGWRREPRRRRSFTKLVRRYDISTGGWSGNEDLINAMMDNHIFWAFTWQQSRRGGHYIFEVPEG